jgi:hypothetical protein
MSSCLLTRIPGNPSVRPECLPARLRGKPFGSRSGSRPRFRVRTHPGMRFRNNLAGKSARGARNACELATILWSKLTRFLDTYCGGCDAVAFLSQVNSLIPKRVYLAACDFGSVTSLFPIYVTCILTSLTRISSRNFRIDTLHSSPYYKATDVFGVYRPSIANS